MAATPAWSTWLLLIAVMTACSAHAARPMAAGRNLRGDARAAALSDGGPAVASSLGRGDAKVDTTAISSKGGSAVAQQAADAGNHSVAVLAVGDSVSTVEQHSSPGSAAQRSNHSSVAWDKAPSCPFPPTASNSVKDDWGRLWGWSNDESCAFRSAVYDLWASAPPCPASLPRSKAVRDKSGRWWGWHKNASCAFKDKQRAGATRSLLADPAANNSTPEPSNAGLPSVTRVTTNTALPVVLVDAVQPTPLNESLPATAGSTVVTTIYGSGPDAVACNLVTTQEPGGNTSRSQLKCEKSPDAPATPGPSSSPTPPPPTAAAAGNAAPAAGPAPNAVGAIAAAPNAATPISLPADASSAPPAGDTLLNMSDPMVQPPSSSAPTPNASGTAVPEVPAADSRAEGTIVNRFGSTWAAAPACIDLPTKRTSVQDTLGRLWWWEQDRSCAYRDAAGESIYYAGYLQVKWETAPTCTDKIPTLINSMSDAEARLWGWERDSKVNCVYRRADGTAYTRQQLLDMVSQLAASKAGPNTVAP